ncbi:lysine exporter LysO family protein [Anaerovorax odorimutans]|uniref:Lysine exporter LysO family protein n=1 Tax=Anaerovorax odorimutans TaxID=109327 RepID=A0ABT1RJ52_9FIRM|nr:lysine exporter LysO family protein [Anaerovorax odorimutans]MCQ4635210.1 lysine exporter LysO family protein [Anaerovorax odorimutans]
MTKAIVISVAAGILAGYFVLPGWFIDISGNLLVVGLCVLLFFVGLDIGREGTVGANFKKAGWRVLVFPFAIIFGTLAGAFAGALILPSLGIRDALAIGSGFGWYTMAPVMLAKYSTYVSALSFMHNVMRELFGILLIPIVAKKIGYIETIALPGSAAMDVCLPIVEKATRGDIAVYSFISGVVMSIAVPVLVGFIAGV